MQLDPSVAVLAAVLGALSLSIGDASAQSVPAGCDASPGRTPSQGAAITIYPDVPLYIESFGEGRIPGEPLKFRTRVTKLPAPRKGDRILVKVTEGAQCGYIQASKILGGKPLKVIEFDPDPQMRIGILGFGGARTDLTPKAILRSNPKLDTTAHEAQLFDAPGGKRLKSARVFTLFNVFKIEKKGTDTDDWWYFVAGRKVADTRALSGWVRGSNLLLWASGVAVYPSADKSAPFDVYTDVQALAASGRTGLIATRSGLEPPDDRDIFKFPILDQVFRNALRDRRMGIPPIAYEIVFLAETAKVGKGTLTPKTSDLPITQLVDVSALKDGPFVRLGLTPEEVERVLNLKQLMTRGYVSYDATKRNIAFFAAMEPERFGVFQDFLAGLCLAMSEDHDLRNRTLGLMLTLAHNLGGDPNGPTETIAEFLDRVVFIPKRHFASWLHKSANDFANEWGIATGEHRTRLELSACRSAYLLQQMGAGQKVESIDDLEFDAALGIQLKPGRSLRTYSWLWSTESKIEFYFVPVEYLPKDN